MAKIHLIDCATCGVEFQHPANTRGRVPSKCVAHRVYVKKTVVDENGRQTLKCSLGNHEWKREPKRGKAPVNCDQHKPIVATPKATVPSIPLAETLLNHNVCSNRALEGKHSEGFGKLTRKKCKFCEMPMETLTGIHVAVKGEGSEIVFLGTFADATEAKTVADAAGGSVDFRHYTVEEYASFKADNTKSSTPVASGPVELHCLIGDHKWEREAKRGRKPSSCPDHKPIASPRAPGVLKVRTLPCEGNGTPHTFEHSGKGANPKACPDHKRVVTVGEKRMQNLHCQQGMHTYQRESKRGKAPKSCPDHTPVAVPTQTRKKKNTVTDAEGNVVVLDSVDARIAHLMEQLRLNTPVARKSMTDEEYQQKRALQLARQNS